MCPGEIVTAEAAWASRANGIVRTPGIGRSTRQTRVGGWAVLTAVPRAVRRLERLEPPLRRDTPPLREATPPELRRKVARAETPNNHISAARAPTERHRPCGDDSSPLESRRSVPLQHGDFSSGRFSFQVGPVLGGSSRFMATERSLLSVVELYSGRRNMF